MSSFRAKEQHRKEHRSMHRQSKGSPISNNRLLFVFLHHKICQLNPSSLSTAKSMEPSNMSIFAFRWWLLPLHQVYWRFKTKFNNYQNSLNSKWEKCMQNRLTDPQLMRRQIFSEWPKRYAGLPEAECLNNSRKLSSFEHLLIPSQTTYK